MKRIFSLLLAVMLCMVFCAHAASSLPKASEQFYFNDLANVLEYETKGVIYFNNESLYDACGAQIVVMTTKDLSGYAMDKYAELLFNNWGVGSEKRDNGFLLAMYIGSTPDDGNYYLVRGQGASPILGNDDINDMLDRYLEPDFAVGKYDKGVNKLFKALFETVRDYYGINLAYMDAEALIRTGKLEAESTSEPGGTYVGGSYAPSEPENRGGKGGVSIMPVIIGIILIALVIWIISNAARRSRGGTARVFPVFVSPRRARPAPPPPRPAAPRPMSPPPAARPASPRSTTGNYRSAQRTGSFGSAVRPSSGASGAGRSTGFSAGRSSVRSSSTRSTNFGSARGGGGRTIGGGGGRR